MNLTFACPDCDQTSRVELTGQEGQTLRCDSCGRHWPVPEGACDPSHVYRCVVCPSTDLFVRKDFSQRMGVAIVVLGIVLSSIAWYWHQVMATYAILFATALIDVVLYVVIGNVLQCYRCQAEYRGLADLETHAAFNLETHEKHRQQMARLDSARIPR